MMSGLTRASGLLPAIVSICLLALVLGCGSGSAVPPSTPTPTGQHGGDDISFTVQSPSGEVLVYQADEGGTDFVQASAGMKLKAGDRVTTGEDGSVLLVFFEGSVIEIGPGSDVSVEELARDAATGSTTVSVWQLVGSTVNRVQNLADSSSKYEVETPSGVAVVRGTTFSLEVDESGDTELRTQEGNVWFTAGGVTVLVGPGEEASSSPGGMPAVSLQVENVEVCSEIRGYRDYDVQDGAFEPGTSVLIYFEVLGVSALAADGGYDTWLRVAEVRVYGPSESLYLSGTDLKEYHQTGLEDVPEYTWGDLSLHLAASTPAGQYRLEAEILDVISGGTDSFTVSFDVGQTSGK